MEKSKEAIKKPCSDIYASKKGVSKTTFLKNNTHLSIRSETGRSKLSYISRSKNVPIPMDKKYGFYGSEAKSFLKHSCDKCGIKAGPHTHIVVNTVSANTSTEVPKIESGHDLNGNVSFNTRPTLCNFAASVSEFSSFNQVLSFQSNPHYELSIPKSTKHKQRTTFTEHRKFSSKVSNSSHSFSANKFFSSIPNSAIRCHCSKSIPQKFTSSEPYLKTSDRTSRENIAVIEKYNSKYVKYTTLPEACLTKDCGKLTDLPIFVNSSVPKDPSMTCKVDYSEDQLHKKRNYSSKKWNHVPIVPDLGESLKNIDETDTMLFPALPTNNHSQQSKLNSSCANMTPSENSPVENSDFESIHALGGAVNVNSLIVSTSVPSTIPQASYADVIRMSVTCSGTQGYVVLDYDKTIIPEQNPATNSLSNSVQEKLPKDDSSQPGSSDWVISRLSQLDPNAPDPVNSVALTHCNQNGQNFVAPRPVVVSLEKPSFYNSSLQTCKNVLAALSSPTNLPSSDKKVVENDNLVVDCLSSLEKISVDNCSSLGSTNRSSVSSDFTTSMTDTQVASIKTDSVYSSPSSVSSFGDAFKPIENRDLNIDCLLKKEPPVIIMNNCSPPDSMSEISFGIDYDEMLKLCSDSCSVEDDVPLAVEEVAEGSLSEKNIGTDSLLPNSSKPPPLPENISTSIKPGVETSVNKSISIKGKSFCWEDSDTDYNQKNHKQLAEYFGGVWNDVQRDYEKGSAIANESKKICFFREL